MRTRTNFGIEIYILLRNDRAWVVGKRILLETLVFYVTVLAVFVIRNTRKRVTYRRLRTAARTCIIYRPFDFESSVTSDLSDFSLLPDIWHQRFTRLFAALAAATLFYLFDSFGIY